MGWVVFHFCSTSSAAAVAYTPFIFTIDSCWLLALSGRNAFMSSSKVVRLPLCPIVHVMHGLGWGVSFKNWQHQLICNYTYILIISSPTFSPHCMYAFSKQIPNVVWVEKIRNKPPNIDDYVRKLRKKNDPGLFKTSERRIFFGSIAAAIRLSLVNRGNL